ncbi:hypothetical protein SOM55_01700 [Pseudomonas coleopterorum]|uniref:NACHT domain-containing protein n=1 Tax=Pseudomonas coleopterorum TaxID=1605838 RepID=UPI002A6A4D30|nr:hypothetical protein [Pseudomonas coleopterorum]MDY1045516.1 hypothetical protein [Pseudomonas coleopterorum]
MDFEFKTFSTRSFERFAQSMALHALGNGVMVFGDGPDGGREASYDGTLNYPSDGESWVGYTVMQAKFLQVPGSPYEDADWLVTQLRAELKKFTKDDSKLRKPDYYILVSNAKLSPVPENERGKGGIAKIDEVFAEYKNALSLKGYRVWHLDQLCTMLMNADAIRRSYAAWLSTSDVIADILADANSKTSAIKDGMYRYLVRELRSHQPIRLQQAGHSGSSQTMIEDVFVDLPFRNDRDTRFDGNEKLLLATLLERSRDCLDGASVNAQQEHAYGRPERVLILGGPGQGKSTLSQFLAQILRANILTSYESGKYPVEVSSIIGRTLSYAGQSELSTEIPRRFPIRIDLPIFADWLSKRESGQSASLLDHIAGHITQISNTEVGVGDLRGWLNNHPTAIILDGLDEVPSSANRGMVLRSINEFWDEAGQADLLMIVTTRPQGYNDDLDPVLYSKLELIPLVPDQAIAYARKLSAALLTDPIQRERVLERICEAAGSRTTARLLVSPLQVAILLSLIDQRGDAPTDRWSLFDKYFGVMLQREQGKPGRVGEIMRHWSRQISAIHYRAGFLLHVEAETLGHSEPQLTSKDLSTLVRGQLEDDGYEGDDLEKSILALIEVSTDRMVLLVQNTQDRYSFEVRSLQEFMAAAYVMSGRESTVQRRLKTIANKTHWLHVFQIAASKCFAENDSVQYRDTVVTICSDINVNGDETDRLLRTGSSLALALLDDGLAYDQPKYRRLLLINAFEMLYAGSGMLPTTLSDHCDREPARTIELLRGYIGSTSSDTVDAAWRLLLGCYVAEQEWAADFIDEVWSDDPSHLAKIFLAPILLPSNSSLLSKLREKMQAVPLLLIKAEYDSNLRNGPLVQQAVFANYPCLRIMNSHQSKRQAMTVVLDGNVSKFMLQFSPLEINDRTRIVYEDLPTSKEWESLQALKAFHEIPSSSALANLLRLIHYNGWEEVFLELMPSLPWPLGTAVYSSIVENCFLKISEEVVNGDYGDRPDWLQAEERWAGKGLSIEDFGLCHRGRFFDREIATKGWPVSQFIPKAGAWSSDTLASLIKLASAATAAPRSQIADYIQNFVDSIDSIIKINLEDISSLFSRDYPGSSGLVWVNPKMLAKLDREILEDEGFLDRLNACGARGNVWIPSHNDELKETYDFLISKVNRYPGLYVALINLVVGDRSPHRFEIDEKLKFLSVCSGGNSLIEDCLNVARFVYDVGRVSEISSSLMKATVGDQYLPSWVLKSYLENDRLDPARTLKIMELIAREMNSNPKFPRVFFMSEIRNISRSRRTELHLPESWVDLEFCKALQDLSAARRAKATGVAGL